MYHILTFSSHGFSSDGWGPPPVFLISDFLWTIIKRSIFLLSYVFKAFTFLNIKYIRNSYQLTKANFSYSKNHEYDYTCILYQYTFFLFQNIKYLLASFFFVWLWMSCHFFFTSLTVLKHDELELTLSE